MHAVAAQELKTAFNFFSATESFPGTARAASSASVSTYDLRLTATIPDAADLLWNLSACKTSLTMRSTARRKRAALADLAGCSTTIDLETATKYSPSSAMRGLEGAMCSTIHFLQVYVGD